MVLDGYEPKAAMKFFEEISQIPRGSGNEKGISDHLVAFAKARNLWVHQDEAYNVIIKKSGSKGFESAAPVILQSHMDMVCEKNNETIHDFEKDPLKLYVEDGFVKAKGTTLGADNGAAVALAMALLDADDIVHPPLEMLFTASEEIGMEGAIAFDPSLFSGKRLINIDSEEEGVFISSCAGGLTAIISLPTAYVDVPDGYATYLLQIKGLLGGHSGMEINKERGNANKLLGRVLHELNQKFDIYINNINGGAKDNAIPREAETIMTVKNDDLTAVKEVVSELEAVFKHEYRVNEPMVTVVLEAMTQPITEVFSKELLDKIIKLIIMIPSGVHGMSLDIEGLVETSDNMGVIRTDERHVYFTCSVRSSVISKKYDLFQTIKMIAETIGASVEVKSEYPAWEFNPDSPIREILVKIHREWYGNEPIVTAIHAGLECGLIGKKMPDLDMVSLGPDIFGAHTPDERMNIASLERTWNLIQQVLLKLLKHKEGLV